ncbi:C40 family peptidase [Nonomuraea dietziae]|uniref:Cell wall-associated NlpC family hydrolase n=1 Tax=Nonomuraea dietziae TaxID=65515 RepID=A0A7W5VF52_9ACTN|nr:C40 family peptidase [Nonomuraea dietziae]MBB3730504.1 cell wall-associated NlpC family hydrolase [Nonomuraea dietziae]
MIRRAPGPADFPHAPGGIRQDLSFLVNGGRKRGRRRALRSRLVPYISVTLALVIAADLALLGEFSSSPDDPGAHTGADTGTVTARKLAPQENLAARSEVAPPVRPLDKLHEPSMFVVTRKPLRRATMEKVVKIKGIRAVELADAASVTIDGKRVQTLGVDPSSFRSYTPKVTASSDGLWANVAGGDVAVSFVLGNDGGLTLGRSVPGPGGQLRIGAYATMGMGAVDAVLSRDKARSLGFPQNNAIVVSAPKVDTAALRRALLRVLPKGSQVAAINPVLAAPKKVTQWSSGSFMTAPQLTTALHAAAGKLGRPYVWGAEGPDTFDCSGLVQWAFAQAGVRMPRVTHQQWVTGPQVPLSQVQPGDLVFWRSDPTNPGYISHVAIYWGNGKVLQAPRTGDVVKISPLSTRNLAGIVRVSPAVAARVR